MNAENMSLKKKNRGSTMAEVLVGFTLLAILMAGVSRIVSVSVNLFMETKEIQNQQVEFQENYFKKNPDSIEQKTIIPAGKLSLVQTNEDGEIISGGSIIGIPQLQVDKLTDSKTKLFVYRFSHKK